MINEMIVATVTSFSGTTSVDKNGEAPVMLQCIAGNMPNRNVLAGTVARRAGFEVGGTYLVNVREQGYDALFGQDFTFIKIKELETGLDIVQAAKQLGEPRIVRIERPEGYTDSYRRKSDAVESNRAVRMREGKYRPTFMTTVSDHSTAAEVRKGSSTEPSGKILSDREFDDSGDLNNGKNEELPGEND